MSFAINTNTASLTAARALYKNTLNLQRSVERMSTGLRVNHAGDDAASAAIADTMEAEIQGLGKATQNAQDGISMAQTIDGGLSAVQTSLQRIRELFVQGSNGTLGADEVDSIQREINEQISVIEDISTTVKFNGVSLLQNSGSSISLQTGAYDSETTALTVGKGGATANAGIHIDIAFSVAADATDNGTLVEGGYDLGVSSASRDAAHSIGFFALDDLHLNRATVDSYSGTVTTTVQNGDLEDIDTMIGNISRMRGSVGAFSNALESKIEFMTLHKENVTASKGRMIDLDVAAESSKLIKSQILQKAATSMLAQANNLPATALDLIP